MNAAILITARLKSQRLPRKVLKPLCGKPMIEHMVERLRFADFTDRIILCTSPLEEDAAGLGGGPAELEGSLSENGSVIGSCPSHHS